MTVPEMPPTRFIDTNGIKMAIHDLGTGPAVVLAHGFPELAYSWRYQVHALAKAGFRVIVPDLRGYGETDRPIEVNSYDITHLTGDVVGLLDVLQLENAIFIGHDWGALICWEMPALHPTRTAGVGALNVPSRFFRKMGEDPIKFLTRTKGVANYMVVMQIPGVAEAALSQDTSALFHRIMRAGGISPEELAKQSDAFRNLHFTELSSASGPEFLSEDEIQMFARTFAATGFTGGINYYRNISRNFELLKNTPEKINVPCLMIQVPNDHFMPPGSYEYMHDFIPDLEIKKVEDCGHWSQQEHHETINHMLVDWLVRRFK